MRILLLIFSVIIGIVLVILAHNDAVSECQKMGGVYQRDICLSPDAVIEYR